MNRRSLAALTLFGSIGCAAEAPDPNLALINHAVKVVAGGTTCAEQGFGDREFTVSPVATGEYAPDSVNSFYLSFYPGSESIFYFTNSSLRMDAILVHGGGGTTVWDLGSENNGWGSLHGPIDPATNEPYLPDGVSFCFDYELFINPNAYARLTLRRTWDILKTGATKTLNLAAGAPAQVAYDVTVSFTGTTTDSFTVDGPVFVRNPTPFATLITGVTVDVGGITADLTCPVTLPYLLPAGGMFECAYIASLPDSSDRMVTAYVTTDGTNLPDASGEELASASKHTSKVIDLDTCVDVVDSLAGTLGTVCEADGSKTFSYTLTAGPYETCGSYDLVNTATYYGHDTGLSESSSWTVTTTVECEEQTLGCTLTQGYWKTHAAGKKYDATWDALSSGPATLFFSSGKSYLQVLNTSSGGGNAYYILAHQYIAAQLNLIAGASLGDAQWVFDEATSYFQAYGPTSAAVTSKKSATRERMILIAGKLAAFNEGDIGPGHCDR